MTGLEIIIIIIIDFTKQWNMKIDNVIVEQKTLTALKECPRAMASRVQLFK